tara:strand:+ start:1022 stop:1327 length:306 start_codon:yes stop_codon:yes gene_type:complete
MNAYEAQIEKLAKEGLLPDEIGRKLALFEYDIYLMTPHSWYMRAFGPDSFTPEDLNSALVTASYDLCRSEKPRFRKQCRKTMRKLWHQAYDNYHDTSMDIH